LARAKGAAASLCLCIRDSLRGAYAQVTDTVASPSLEILRGGWAQLRLSSVMLPTLETLRGRFARVMDAAGSLRQGCWMGDMLARMRTALANLPRQSLESLRGGYDSAMGAAAIPQWLHLPRLRLPSFPSLTRSAVGWLAGSPVASAATLMAGAAAAFAIRNGVASGTVSALTRSARSRAGRLTPRSTRHCAGSPRTRAASPPGSSGGTRHVWLRHDGPVDRDPELRVLHVMPALD
jgi:hypothetical protein